MLIGFGAGLLAPTSPTGGRDGGLFPEEDHVALAVHDETLTQQLRRSGEAATDGSRGFAFVRISLPA